MTAEDAIQVLVTAEGDWELAAFDEDDLTSERDEYAPRKRQVALDVLHAVPAVLVELQRLHDIEVRYLAQQAVDADLGGES